MTLPNRARLVLAALAAGLLAVALQLIAPGIALADTGTTPVGTSVTSFGLGDWLGLGLRLGLVLVVIWGAVIVMRWYVRRMNGEGGRAAGRQLQVLETRTLG